MIYCCDNCGFLFSRRGEISACPQCESRRIRPALDAEKKKLEAQLKNSKHGNEYVR